MDLLLGTFAAHGHMWCRLEGRQRMRTAFLPWPRIVLLWIAWQSRRQWFGWNLKVCFLSESMNMFVNFETGFARRKWLKSLKQSWPTNINLIFVPGHICVRWGEVKKSDIHCWPCGRYTLGYLKAKERQENNNKGYCIAAAINIFKYIFIKPVRMQNASWHM